VAFVPLDEVNGEPHPERIVHASRRSPVKVKLAPGNYLVVAALENHGFHEVYRHVPKPAEQFRGTYAHQRWNRVSDRMIQLQTIRIPRDAEAGMVLFDAADDFQMGESNSSRTPAHHRRIPAFYLDPAEFTLADLKHYADATQGPPHYPAELRGNLPPDTYSAAYVTYDEALYWAEAAGKRLPDEAEFEYAATACGTRRFPWGDEVGQEADAHPTHGPVRVPAFDRLNTNPPVYGLGSNVAEWTTSWFSPYDRALQGESAAVAADQRVVRGGLLSADRVLTPAECRNPRARQGKNRRTFAEGIGFRCARSAKPRFSPTDFVTVLQGPGSHEVR
jgi:formylglycine-generating enzyme required for sulfatase activity